MNRGEVAKDKSVFLAVAVWEKLWADEFDKQINQDRNKAEAHWPVYEQLNKAEKIGVELLRERIVQGVAQDKYTEYWGGGIPQQEYCQVHYPVIAV